MSANLLPIEDNGSIGSRCSRSITVTKIVLGITTVQVSTEVEAASKKRLRIKVTRKGSSLVDTIIYYKTKQRIRTN